MYYKVYCTVCAQINIKTLYDLCNNKYDCIALNNNLSYRVPFRTHCRGNCRLFAISTCRSNAGKRSPFSRIVNIYNDNFTSIDILATRVGCFKKEILSILKPY